MTSNVQRIDNIRLGFPRPTVEPIENEPKYKTINRLHDELKSSAASIPTTLGSGNYGLLGLVIQPAVYTTVTGVNFVAPANPGIAPDIPDGATGAQIGALTRRFSAEQKVYLEYHRIDQALKQLLLGAVKEVYVESLRDMYTNYTTVTILELLTHLYNNYGQISAMDLDKNERRIKTKYNPNEPIDKLFKQIEMADEYAKTGKSPFTAKQIVNNAFLRVFATGVYEDECKNGNQDLMQLKLGHISKLISCWHTKTGENSNVCNNRVQQLNSLVLMLANHHFWVILPISLIPVLSQISFLIQVIKSPPLPMQH